MTTRCAAALAVLLALQCSKTQNQGGDGTDAGGAGAAGAPVVPTLPLAPTGIELRRAELPYEPEPAVSDADFAALQAAHRTFALRLYRELASTAPPEQSLIVSPYSVSRLMAMTYAGAGGNTATELASVLGFDAAPEAVHPAMNLLAKRLGGLAESSKLDLRAVNALWLTQDLSPEPAFLDVLSQQYDTGTFLVDFADDPEGARLAINDWVMDCTEGLVPDLIPAGEFGADTVLALSGVLYFAAPWQYGFYPDYTMDGEFVLPSGAAVSVPLMWSEAEFPRAAGTDYHAVELPYADSPVSMIAVLPTTGDLAAFESTLDSTRLVEIADALGASAGNSGRFSVTMPRFSFDTELDLAAVLQSLGVIDAFIPMEADFSGIRPGGLYVQTAVQQSHVAVDEYGTVATAAAAEFLPTVGFHDSIDLTRPFLFFIYDRDTGTALFVGRVADPRAQG
jgi:serpin B